MPNFSQAIAENIGSELRLCPFCHERVKLEYNPMTSYSITCCASMELQICDALESRGLRFKEQYKWVSNEEGYTEEAKSICREELTKAWNTRGGIYLP